MKRLGKTSWLLIALTLLALPACGGGNAAARPTVDTAPIYTQIASTALALQTQTALAVPTATQTPRASSTPKATETPLFTDTPQPGTQSGTPNALNTPKSTSQNSCDNMAFVGDVTIPDGYSAAPDEAMDKTWTVKNLGPCTWNQNYRLVFGWGGAGTNWQNATVKVYKDVKPGETIDLTLTLKAPSSSGEYRAFFVLQNDKGVNFPPGQAVAIYIKVQ